MLGARRIVAAGRNLEALASENLDGVVSLTQGDDAIREAFAVEAGKGIDVVIDYLWGRPTELLLEALAKGFDPNAAQAHTPGGAGRERREDYNASGGHAAQHRPEANGQRVWLGAAGTCVRAPFRRCFRVGRDWFSRVTTEPVPLAEVETAWNRKESGRRIVFTT